MIDPRSATQEEIDATLADMERYLRMDVSEGEQFGHGFKRASLTVQQEKAIAAYEATAPARRAILEKAGRITITEAPANDLGVRPGESSPERMLGNVLAVLIVILACVVGVIIKACEGAK
jgi:hypothetical protein